MLKQMRRSWEGPSAKVVLVVVGVFFSIIWPLLRCAAQARRPMRFEDLAQMKRVGDPAVSPDGKWVLFSVVEVDLEHNAKTSHLWIVPLTASKAGAGQALPLTASRAGESRGRFSPDGTRILFLSARDGGQQVYTAAFDSTRGTLGDAKAVTEISTEADGPTWSPDGASILFVSSVYPDCPDDACNRQRDEAAAKSPVKAEIFTSLLFRHWNHFTGPKRSHLFLVASSGGAARDLTPGLDHDVPPFSLGGPDGYGFSPDGKEVAYTANLDTVEATSTNSDLFVLRLDDAGANPVRITSSPGADNSPNYSPDGRYIAYRSQLRAGYESDRWRLMLYDRESKQSRELLPKFDRWVEETGWSADSKTLYFTADESGEVVIRRVATDGSGLELVASDGEFGDLHIAGTRILATRMTITQPAEVVVIEDGQQRQITHLNDALLAGLDLPKMESFWFKGALQSRVQGFVVRPPGFDPARKYPVKFLIHGGPQGAWGDAWSYRWNPELFAASGYVVVMINPRGSIGYGQSFTDGVNGDWGGKPYIDLMRGLDYAEANYPFIDKSRECALGASYGGYMANWILGHTDRFACVVSHDGMFNTESAYGSTEELWFNEWEFKGTPWDKRLSYRKWSPALFAKNFKTPTLVIHGQLDYRLDVSQGYDLFTTLQRQRVPSKMLYFPDEGHWVLKPQNSRLWYETVNDWVDLHTRSNP